MATVRSNARLAAGIGLLAAAGRYRGDPGQFYMLRAWGAYPVLSRPLSIHDIGEDGISFLYRIAGVGTALLSRLRPGDELQLEGPYGQGFPPADGTRIALVGGGMGTAPLRYALRHYPGAHVYLGFSGEPFGLEPYREAGAPLTVTTGGTVVDAVDPGAYARIFACGPVPMLRALADKTAGTDARLYVSTEKRMACGIGACLGCTVNAAGGNRKVCKDGPVFAAAEVDWDAFDAL